VAFRPCLATGLALFNPYKKQNTHAKRYGVSTAKKMPDREKGIALKDKN
jgi:hypothetical protein